MIATILAVGDSYMPAQVFKNAFEAAKLDEQINYATISQPTKPSQWPIETIREYEGSPEEMASLLKGHEILALHGAPVTAEVMDANPQLRLIACARGGPVNVDLPAAKERQIAVTTTPGKNAQAVAELTLGLIINLLRNTAQAQNHVVSTAAKGGNVNESAFEGARWFGQELGGARLGLVGYGHIARIVAKSAITLGMNVQAYDPLTDPENLDVAPAATLSDLLRESDVLSLHARATSENYQMIASSEFAELPRGAKFINTARESLVDETALLDALRSGQVSGAALDVFEPTGCWRELAHEPNVIMIPHIAGATHQTLARGASMLAEDIGRFRHGKPLKWAP